MKSTFSSFGSLLGKAFFSTVKIKFILKERRSRTPNESENKNFPCFDV